ncbi:undecaprenyldiphospho-muramoylpentapeptide beta-N-acetylglucosaminyltransferase [uncultured Peptoniphilus sp.]|uniref:undecaprenyldiphospho-muramoylpentapeptide beta-N-acetylglucosaminyltransferase n=1 Tax=uncultured Peptoniphilus sp. TaxID=254354 RepID=UPI002805CDF3|nr:undecaprenyldiphospho-muramoylpentapeptide beta-N-acetylglucosaminyltransferase [uncultured Peptoniphilus sp.]
MKYILSGGGTGGHIYPALAICHELEKEDKDAEILYVGKKDSLEEELVKKEGFAFKSIHISGLPRKKINKDTVITMFNLLRGLNECEKIIKEFKPDVVIGTGGYVCAPIVMKAQQKGIKTVIQEQNAFPGKTNRFLSRKADLIFLNFREAQKYFNNEHIIFTGNPVREDFSYIDRNKARNKLKLKEEKLVFSFGGSGGQESTNDVLKEILKDQKDLDFKLVHVTGKEHYKNFIADLDIPKNVEILDYTYEVPTYLMASDLVIASSSAMTLAEISAVGLASILIPKAYTAGNHQVFNANSYENMGASSVITEDILNGQRLLEEIQKILKDHKLREEMAENSKKLGNPKAVKEIVKEILERLA